MENLSQIHRSSESLVSLREELGKEKFKSEHYRLNYERMKTAYIQIRQFVNMKNDPANEVDKIPASTADKGIQVTQPACTNGNINIEKEIRKEIATDPSDDFKETGYWKKMYIQTIDDYQRYKAEMLFVIESDAVLLDEKVKVLLEEAEIKSKDLEDENTALVSSSRKLNLEKRALECEIQTLRDELEETRQKLIHLEQKAFNYSILNLQKTEDSNFFTAPDNAIAGLSTNGTSHELTIYELRGKISILEVQNQHLGNEVQQLHTRNCQLTEEIKAISHEYDLEVKRLKEFINTYEHELAKEREDFDSKITETQLAMQDQQNFIAEVDVYIKDRDETQTKATGQLISYTTTLLTESNKTILELEEKLESSNALKKELSTNLTTAIQAIDKLKKLPSLSYNIVFESCTRIYATFSMISPKSTFSSDDKSPPESDPELICEEIRIILFNLSKDLGFRQNEVEARIRELEKHTRELESTMQNQKAGLLDELEEVRNKLKTYKCLNTQIRHRLLRGTSADGKGKGLDAHKNLKTTILRSTDDVVDKYYENILKQVLNERNIFLQSKHAKFREILECVDDYV